MYKLGKTNLDSLYRNSCFWDTCYWARKLISHGLVCNIHKSSYHKHLGKMEKLYTHFIWPLYINYGYQNYKHEPCNKADEKEQILPTQKHHIMFLAYYNSTQGVKYGSEIYFMQFIPKKLEVNFQYWMSVLWQITVQCIHHGNCCPNQATMPCTLCI